MNIEVGQTVHGYHGRGRVLRILPPVRRSPYSDEIRLQVDVEFDCGYRDFYDVQELDQLPRHSCNCVGLAELIRSFGFGDDYVNAVHRLPIGLDRMREALEIL